MNTPDDDFLPIRALNDLLFCARRCALHRLEGLWEETVHTVQGTQAHQKAHAEPRGEEERADKRVVRGMWLRSDRLRLVGKADVVEFRPGPFPIEYKRGRRRKWDNDDVQLCAQALCLEEMLGVEVPAGAVFHVKSKRRREVVFDAKLRRQTEEAAAALHELMANGRVPAPVLRPRCKGCSLHDVCMPEVISDQTAYRRAALELFVAS